MAYAQRCDTCNGAASAWMALLEPRDRALLQQMMRPRVLEPGDTLYLQGDECDGIYCVQSGLIGLRQSDEEGDAALLRLCQSGELLGYRSLLTRSPHRNTAEVLTLSRVCFFEASQMLALIDRNKALSESFQQLALADLTRAESNCAVLLTAGLKRRLHQLLRMLYERYGQQVDEGEYLIELPIQRKDLAALLGATPESISRLIKEVGERGIIFNGRKVAISAALSGFSPAPVASASPAVSAESISAALAEARSALLAMIDSPEGPDRDALRRKVHVASARLDALLQGLDPRRTRSAACFREVWEEFKATRNERIIPAIYAGRPETARRIATGIQAERLARMNGLMPALASASEAARALRSAAPAARAARRSG